MSPEAKIKRKWAEIQRAKLLGEPWQHLQRELLELIRIRERH